MNGTPHAPGSRGPDDPAAGRVPPPPGVPSGAQPPGAQPPGAQPPGAQPPGAQPPPPGAPPPGVQPPPGAQPPPSWQAPVPPAPRTSRRKLWIVLAVVVVVLVGGCATLVAVGGAAFFGAVTEPADAANAYLDAARSSGNPTAYACGGMYQPDPALEASEGQQLSSVDISNNQVAVVEGTITLAGGTVTPVVVDMRREADEWCVLDVRY